MDKLSWTFLEHSSHIRVPGLNATFSTSNTRRVHVFHWNTNTATLQPGSQRHWHAQLWHLYPFYYDLHKIKGLWLRFKPLLWSVFSTAKKRLYLAHLDAFSTSEISLHLQTYFPMDFLMAPPGRGKSGVGGNQANVKQCFKSNFDHKFDTKPSVTLFYSFKLQHYWLSSSEINLHEPKLLFTCCTAL